MNKIKDIKLIEIPKITAPDGRGNLSVVEKNIIPFAIKRVFYLYDVPINSIRGAHAHYYLYQVLIPISGSFDIVVNDGESIKEYNLQKPNLGLCIPNGIWVELKNFSQGAVCLCLVSEEYEESDYIRDYDAFITWKKSL